MRLKTLTITGLFLLISLFYFGQSGATVSDSILSGGVYRKYTMYVPNSYNSATAAPLVINLHGYTSNAAAQQIYSNFMPIADTAGFLMVFPDGTAPFGSPFWNAGITTAPNDVIYMSDLIDSLRMIYQVDLRRIYSCGFSNGGIMSYYLACNLSNRIAAVASVSGTQFNAWHTLCNPPRPVPVMEVHGTADAIVPYAGDANFAPVDSVVKKWVQHNGCNALPLIDTLAELSTSDNSRAIHHRYLNGTKGSSVELYKITGGSHSWPGSFPIFPNTNLDLGASAQIWRFFRHYTLDQFVSDVGLNENKLSSEVSLFPNPSSQSIAIAGVEEPVLAVFTMDGRQVGYEIQANTLPVSDLKAGLYFLRVRKGGQSAMLRFIKN